MQRYFEKIKERLGDIDPQEMMSEEQRNVLNYCIDIVNQVAEEYANDGWIPCSVRQPEEPESYEVTVRVLVNGKIEYITDYGVFLESGKWLTLNVVAWRERVKPYQPEGGQQ